MPNMTFTHYTTYIFYYQLSVKKTPNKIAGYCHVFYEHLYGFFCNIINSVFLYANKKFSPNYQFITVRS